MVNLTRIYTRTGDDGSTALGDFSRTTKTDPRLVAYADTDESNSSIGVAVTCGALREDVLAVLVRIQNDLFDVGADLCTPLAASYEYPPLRVQDVWVDELEADCDRFNNELEKLRSFILPSGTPGSAYLHVARTVTRRAERSAWKALEAYGDQPAPEGSAKGVGGVNPLTAKVPQPSLGPVVHPGTGGQPRDRRGRALAAGWRAGAAAREPGLGSCQT